LGVLLNKRCREDKFKTLDGVPVDSDCVQFIEFVDTLLVTPCELTLVVSCKVAQEENELELDTGAGVFNGQYCCKGSTFAEEYLGVDTLRLD
jgi:hypothetical protein